MQGMLPLLIAAIAALAIVVIAVGISMSGGGGVVRAPRALRVGRDDGGSPKASRSRPSSPASRASSSART